MMSTVISAIQEWALIFQIGFVISGLIVAIGGRFIHDKFILLTGWLIGAGTGFWASSVIITGINITGFAKVVFIGASTLLLGAIGAKWLWHWYVFLIGFTGTVLSYIGFTIVFGLPPYSTIIEAFGAMSIFLIASSAVGLGLIPGLAGLFIILIVIPLIINNKKLIQRWQDLSLLKEEITEGGVSISIRILGVIGIFLGIFLIGINIVVWIWPFMRNLIMTHVDAFVSLLQSPALVSMVIVMAAILMGGVAWILHHKLLILETAAIGATLVSVAGVADQFLIALFNLEFAIVSELIRSSALLFVVIFLFGVGVQSGATYEQPTN